MSQKKDILVKVGYETYGDNMQVEERKEFDTFEEANKWSTIMLKAKGYDTAQFFHIQGKGKMQSVINEYLESL